MILLYRFLELIIQVTILLFIIAFERVVGFPILFLTTAISLLLISKSLPRYIIFIIASFMLAIFYQIAFVLAFILIAFIYLGFVLGTQIIESNLKRFLFLLAIVIVILFLIAKIDLKLILLAQVFLGAIISSWFLLKFIFIRYGFLGTKMNSRHSFFR